MAQGNSVDGQDAGLDLVTVRETLALIHEDLRRRPDLVAVRKALVAAIEEISVAEARAGSPLIAAATKVAIGVDNVVVLPRPHPRFVRWTPAG